MTPFLSLFNYLWFKIMKINLNLHEGWSIITTFITMISFVSNLNKTRCNILFRFGTLQTPTPPTFYFEDPHSQLWLSTQLNSTCLPTTCTQLLRIHCIYLIFGEPPWNHLFKALHTKVALTCTVKRNFAHTRHSPLKLHRVRSQFQIHGLLI